MIKKSRESSTSYLGTLPSSPSPSSLLEPFPSPFLPDHPSPPVFFSKLPPLSPAGEPPENISVKSPFPLHCASPRKCVTSTHHHGQPSPLAAHPMQLVMAENGAPHLENDWKKKKKNLPGGKKTNEKIHWSF